MVRARAVCPILLLAPILLTAAGCGQEEAGWCAGTVITVPGDVGEGGFGVPQLMASATAMGMTQGEAETLIYLEGISPQATFEAGDTICLDGTPG